MVTASASIEQVILHPFPLNEHPVIETGFGTRLAGWLGLGASAVSRRWEYLKTIGNGTSAQVYQVADRKTRRMMALKIYRPGLVSEQVLSGPERSSEGEILARLSHPGIVRGIEHGVTETGQYYVVTEYVAGPSLDNLAANYAGDRLSLVRKAAESLAVVHEAGYLHCDVCPQNYLLTEDGEVKLFDFGSALSGQGKYGKTSLRVSRSEYLPPELLRSDALGPNIDKFQLGVTAYELMTGAAPWKPQASCSSVARMIRRADDIRDHLPQIDERLAQAIHRMLLPDPSKRFGTIREFLRAIQGVAGNASHETRPIPQLALRAG